MKGDRYNKYFENLPAECQSSVLAKLRLNKCHETTIRALLIITVLFHSAEGSDISILIVSKNKTKAVETRLMEKTILGRLLCDLKTIERASSTISTTTISEIINIAV